MKRIVLISCCKKKKNLPCKACVLYESDLFRKSYKYAVTLKPDRIFILSAKHHLLESNEVISPYDLSLNEMNTQEVKNWAEKVIQQLSSVSDLNGDDFTVLAGNKYRKYLINRMDNYEVPMERMRIGKQLSWLKKKVG